jgi:hypothetical protein
MKKRVCKACGKEFLVKGRFDDLHVCPDCCWTDPKDVAGVVSNLDAVGRGRGVGSGALSGLVIPLAVQALSLWPRAVRVCFVFTTEARRCS